MALLLRRSTQSDVEALEYYSFNGMRVFQFDQRTLGTFRAPSFETPGMAGRTFEMFRAPSFETPKVEQANISFFRVVATLSSLLLSLGDCL